MGRSGGHQRAVKRPEPGSVRFDEAPRITACPVCDGAINATAIVLYANTALRDMGDYLAVENEHIDDESQHEFFCVNGHDVGAAIAERRAAAE